MSTISESILEDIKTSNGYLKIYVSLPIVDRTGRYLINKFPAENGNIISVRFNPKLVIKMDFTDTKWSILHQIAFNKTHILRFQRILMNYLKKILTGKNYMYDESGDVLIDVLKDRTDIGFYRMETGYILFEPDILEDSKHPNIRLPGIRLTINEPGNVMILSIDEFEDIVYAINKLDLIAVGNNLAILQESISNIRGETIAQDFSNREPAKTNITGTNGTRSIYDNVPNEYVSGIIQSSKKTSLFDI